MLISGNTHTIRSGHIPNNSPLEIISPLQHNTRTTEQIFIKFGTLGAGYKKFYLIFIRLLIALIVEAVSIS
jgi:hypothetical protein